MRAVRSLRSPDAQPATRFVRPLPQALSAMHSLLRMFESAQFVILVWFGSALLPILMLYPDSSSNWSRILSIVMVMALGIGITRFRSRKKAQGSWLFSDTVAYILVPIAIFVFITWASLYGSST